jgi:hypothetical protein
MVVRAAFFTGVSALGAVVGVVACSAAFHPSGTVATAAITAIGGICATVTGVAASALRSVRCFSRQDQHNRLTPDGQGSQRCSCLRAAPPR